MIGNPWGQWTPDSSWPCQVDNRLRGDAAVHVSRSGSIPASQYVYVSSVTSSLYIGEFVNHEEECLCRWSYETSSANDFDLCHTSVTDIETKKNLSVSCLGYNGSFRMHSRRDKSQLGGASTMNGGAHIHFVQ